MGKYSILVVVSGGGTDCVCYSIEHFCAARDLVGLAECSRSISALQTILCAIIYLKSIHAQRMVHTYTSVAVSAV